MCKRPLDTPKRKIERKREVKGIEREGERVKGKGIEREREKEREGNGEDREKDKFSPLIPRKISRMAK